VQKLTTLKLLILLKPQPLERKKNEKRDKKGTRIGYMTEHKKAPKPCKVLQHLFPKLNESMKLLQWHKFSGEHLLIIHYWL